MKKVFKYVLENVDSQVIRIPSECILSVEEQNGEIVVYALVDTDIEPINYEFGINGTGNPFTFEVEDFDFLGTVKMHNGRLMFHVFYKKNYINIK